MAARWVIEIEHAAGTYTLDANHKFDFEMLRQVNNKGVVEYIDLNLAVKAQVVRATPGDVADGFKDVYDLGALRQQPMTVRFKLDGVEKFVWQQSTSVAGPTIVNVNTDEADGNAGSRWLFRIDFWVRLPGSNFNGLHDLQTFLTIGKDESGRVISKTWQVVGKAQTMELARTGVMRFKPTGKVTEVTKLGFDPEPSFAATWMWQPTHRALTEEIMIIGGGDIWEVDPQAGVRVKPLLHLARAGAQVMRVDGQRRGLMSEALKPPAPHWKESKDITRQYGLEPQSKATVRSEEDAQLGLKTLLWSEIYVNTGRTLPEPNHGDHAGTQTVEKPPADGAIAR